jgi:hypothetical protein
MEELTSGSGMHIRAEEEEHLYTLITKEAPHKWEYMCRACNWEELVKLGEEGWELACYVEDPILPQHVAYLKRKVYLEGE